MDGVLVMSSYYFLEQIILTNSYRLLSSYF